MLHTDLPEHVRKRIASLLFDQRAQIGLAEVKVLGGLFQ